jgi:hypothetical protein
MTRKVVDWAKFDMLSPSHKRDQWGIGVFWKENKGRHDRTDLRLLRNIRKAFNWKPASPTSEASKGR